MLQATCTTQFRACPYERNYEWLDVISAFCNYNPLFTLSVVTNFLCAPRCLISNQSCIRLQSLSVASHVCWLYECPIHTDSIYVLDPFLFPRMLKRAKSTSKDTIGSSMYRQTLAQVGKWFRRCRIAWPMPRFPEEEEEDPCLVGISSSLPNCQ